MSLDFPLTYVYQAMTTPLGTFFLGLCGVCAHLPTRSHLLSRLPQELSLLFL